MNYELLFFVLFLAFISGFGIIFEIELIRIYFKHGNFDLIKGYKLALLILCLLESLSYLELERWKELDNDTKHTIHSDFCFLVGTLKNIIGFAKESIQVTLLLITYCSFTFQSFIQSHPMLLRNITLLLNIIPICIISVDEFKTLNTHSNKFNSYFCSKDVEAQSGLFICFIIFLVIFLVLLTLLYCSVYKYSRISNSDSTFKSYKRHFIMYLFGHIFTFPYILIMLYEFIYNQNESLFMKVISTIYYISLVISPIAIVLIYCFDKQMLESMLCCCCHKKKTEVNKELTISLFEEQ